MNTLIIARKNKELWDTDNGITLCKICHSILYKQRRIGDGR